MELTTKQIQKIDTRLEKDGIKYWDIRVELLDHVVTDVQLRLDKGEKLEKAITNSFIALGWNGDLKRLNKIGWQNVSDTYRREHFKGVLNYFKSIKNNVLFIISNMLLYFLSDVFTFKSFINVCFIIFSLPLIFVIFLYIKTAIRKYGKSVNLDYGFFYLTFSFMILQAVPSLFESQSELVQKTVWIVVLSIHFLSIYSGYNLFKKAIQKIENMHKQLLS